MEIKIIKKDQTIEPFKAEKIKKAVSKSANRVLINFTEQDLDKIVSFVLKEIEVRGLHEVTINQMHNMVEKALENDWPEVAKSYRDYRNYKVDFVHMLDEVYTKSQSIMYIGDKENSNTDSALVSTRRSLIYNELNRELYKKFFLNVEELQAINDGYIYIHDMCARRDTMNCCLFDVGRVLKSGFEMGNIWYNEPKTLDTAFDVIGDIVLSTAAQQYGGFTVPSIDLILDEYAEKSYAKYYHKYVGLGLTRKKADEQAIEDVRNEFKQGWQGLEYKFNTVGSSRGDYPFITVTLGTGTTRFAKMCTLECLKVRRGGQGKPGRKRPVLFPKIVFLYDKNLHGEGCINEDLFEEGILCSSKTMYPDWLSLTGEGYISDMYKKYGRIISPMGCVDGQEIITYKFNGKLYVESFQRLWLKMVELFDVLPQNGECDFNTYIDCKNLEIYDTLKGFVKVNRLISNHQDNWCDVKLNGGRRIRVTTDHPFETSRGVVQAKDLVKEDKIIINNRQYSENTDDINNDVAWLEGMTLCDGCYQNHSFFISIAAEGEDDIEEVIKATLKYRLGYESETILQERGPKGRYKDIRIYARDNKNFGDLISYCERLFGGINKNKRQIPNEVFSYKTSAKMAFLAGMIDADGYINNKKHKVPVVQLGSTNKELALQQMALAQSLNMPARIYENHYTSKDKEKIRYRVEFYPNSALISHMKCRKKTNVWWNSKNKVAPTKADFEEKTVRGVVDLDIKQYSYDVSTDSEHFEVSGIYSHNCRAFLSPWYERGGESPADEDDKPVFVGRFNVGAISLHLPMILAKAKQENKDFYEVLDYYLNLIRKLHCRTYDYLGEMRASTNPLAYCQGGFYGGNLKPTDKIKPLLKSATASFGYTALNELQELYNGKSIAEDGEFALEVLKHINDKVAEFKKADGHLYAIYGTPAENLCGLQIKQFRKKYGIVEHVSDRPYVSNSFHCHVTEDITPIEKQDKERKFWEYTNGGKIQYVKYPIDYNIGAIKTLIRRAMDFGYYEGVNLSLAYCEDCGHQELAMDVCPKCGSRNLTKIERMNGYLSYSRVNGDTRLNDAKMAEIAERKSM